MDYSDVLKDKVVLVTGGTGSFGQKFNYLPEGFRYLAQKFCLINSQYYLYTKGI